MEKKKPNLSSDLQRLPPPGRNTPKSDGSLGESIAGYSWRGRSGCEQSGVRRAPQRQGQPVIYTEERAERAKYLFIRDLRPLPLKTKENVSFPLANATLGITRLRFGPSAQLCALGRRVTFRSQLAAVRRSNRSERRILTAQLLMGGDLDPAQRFQHSSYLAEPRLTLKLLLRPFPLAWEGNKDGRLWPDPLDPETGQRRGVFGVVPVSVPSSRFR